MMTIKQAVPPSEGDTTNREVDVTEEMYDNCGSSSSDEDSNVEVEELVGVIDNAPELTLVDDETPLLVQPAEEIGEADDPVNEATSTPFIEDYGEFDGEGLEEFTIPTEIEEKKVVEKKDGERKKKKRRRKKWLNICLVNCKYDVGMLRGTNVVVVEFYTEELFLISRMNINKMRRTARKFGFKEVSDDDDWTLYWTDFSVALERVMDMKKYQKINHFPGMSEICRKDMLARNLTRMQKMFPKEYNVFPKTWCLPADYGDFQTYTRQKKNKTYILKPESGCQGRGIWVTRNPKEVKPHEHMICQVYVTKPFLIDGYKFDLRIYVLITSCDPLRIFIFKDGLARFATNKYSEPSNSNTDNVYMHLTNYAINKHSQDFVRDDEAGSKRRISTINKYLKEKGYDIDKLWSDIDDVIIKTLISAHSVLKHNYRTCFPNHVRGSACFEILGIDILLDRKLKPHILEVNHSPSFTTDAVLDKEIKGTLIWDTLGLINFGAMDKRKYVEEERRRIKDRLLGKCTKKETKEELEVAQSQYIKQLEKYENDHLGNFRRIYPLPGSEKYEKYFHSSGTLFQETAAFKARQEMARQQREEIVRKKEKYDVILKGKVRKDLMRPESPGRRKLTQRPTLPLRHLNNQKQSLAESSAIATPRAVTPMLLYTKNVSDREACELRDTEPVDTMKPMDILADEELERLSGLLHRDNLVRGLGIVEHVYRLLHCTPGTVGIIKPEQRAINQTGGLSHTLDKIHCQKMTLRLEMAQRELDLMKPIPNKAKDMQYYKTLFDRYFGPNHVLSQEVTYQRLHPRLPATYLPTRKLTDQQLPLIHCSRSVMSHIISENPGTLYIKPDLQQPQQQQIDNPTSKPSYPNGWKNRGTKQGSFSERTMLAYQRYKLARKPLGFVAKAGPFVKTAEEMESHTMPSIVESDTEKSQQASRSMFQSDWHSNSRSHLHIRTQSGKLRDQDQIRCVSQHVPQSLSIVSAALSLSQRLNTASMPVGFSRQHTSLH